MKVLIPKFHSYLLSVACLFWSLCWQLFTYVAGTYAEIRAHQKTKIASKWF